MKCISITLAVALVLVVKAPPAAATGATAYARQITGLTIDGDLSDWPEGLTEYHLATTGGIYGEESDLLGQDLLSSGDLSATFRVGYDPSKGLIYIGVRVRDDELITGKGWTNTDASEIYLGGADRVWQYFLVPGAGEYSPGSGNPGMMAGDFAKAGAQAAWKRNGDVTTYEWALSPLGDVPSGLSVPSAVALKPGARLPFDLAIADRDRTGKTAAWITWGPFVVQKFGDPSRVGSLVLLERDAPLASLIGSLALTGITVHASNGAHIAGSAPVRADGSFEIPVPPGDYELTIDDEYLKVGASAVAASTTEGSATIHAALFHAQPPEPTMRAASNSDIGSDAFRSAHTVSQSVFLEEQRKMEAMHTITWSVLFVSLFTFLTFREILQQRTRRAAIQSGQPIPGPPPTDPRKMALILISLGIGFAVAMATTLSYIPDHGAPHPLAIAVWGLVPVLLGGALWLYHHLAEEGSRFGD